MTSLLLCIICRFDVQAVRACSAISMQKKNHLAEIVRTLQLAMPVVIGMVASFSMNFVDTLMAGRLDDKEIALAGIATGGAIWSAALMFILGVLMSLQPVVAQLDGSGKQSECGAVVRQGLWIAIGVAVPFVLILISGGDILQWMAIDAEIIPTSVAYMSALSWGVPAICLLLALRFFSEGSGYTKPTMYMGLLGILMNVPLNYILMFRLPTKGVQPTNVLYTGNMGCDWPQYLLFLFGGNLHNEVLFCDRHQYYIANIDLRPTITKSFYNKAFNLI